MSPVSDPHLSAEPRQPGQLDPEPGGRYNLLVIGGGPAGLASALGAAALGARVALVEKGSLGGDSLFSGSVPSKVLLRAAHAAAGRWRARQLGLDIAGEVQVDYQRVLERLAAVQAQIARPQNLDSLLARGIDVFRGEARFTDWDHVQVDSKWIGFSRAVIATGSRPEIPDVPGLAAVPYLTSDTFFQMQTLPRRLGIIGAGPFGCEMAQAFARFGCQVVLFEQAAQCLPQEDVDAAKIIEEALTAEGVVFRLGCAELRVEGGAEIRIHAQSDGRWYADGCDTLLVAAGRVPAVEPLNPEAAGIRTDENGILVNTFLRTTNRHVFAAGDVCSQFKYTHAAESLARIVIANALFFGTERASALLVPWCTYTDPELAHVGLHAQDAAAGHLHTLTLSLEHSDALAIEGCKAGLLKILHDTRGTIRGVTLVAPHAGEMIGEAVLAMNHGIKLGSLGGDVHPYPTVSEIFRIAGDTYRHAFITPAVARFLQRFLGWRR